METYASLYHENMEYLASNRDEILEDILNAIGSDIFYCTKSRLDTNLWILEVFTSREPNVKLQLLRSFTGDGAHFIDYHIDYKYSKCLGILVNPFYSGNGDIEGFIPSFQTKVNHEEDV